VLRKHGLKMALAKMRDEWKPMEMQTFSPKPGKYLLKGTDEIQTLLDDHIIKTQATRSNSFVKPIEREVKEWEARLLYIQSLLDQWLNVQRTWLYLEPIFSSDDIVKQMPEQAGKFKIVDKLWRDTMDAVVENPNMMDVSDIEGLLAKFIDANKQLDIIKKNSMIILKLSVWRSLVSTSCPMTSYL